jgi:hypothetical protein
VTAARATAVVLITTIAIVSACGSPNPTAPTPSASQVANPSLAPVAGGPSTAATAATAAGSIGQTNPEFGPIWDGLPPSFPRLPGATATDLPGAISGAFAIPGEPGPAAEALRSALVGQGLRAEVGTPLEDGTIVVDAGDATAACRIEARLTPRSGTVVMSVRYGASCPYR